MAAVPRHQAPSGTLLDSSCAVQVLSGLGTGVALGVIGAGVVVTWTGPAKNPKLNTLSQFTKLVATYTPLTGFVGGVFSTVSCAAATARGGYDMTGSAVAGCAAGTVIGLQRRSFSSACLGCASFGAAAAIADFSTIFKDLNRDLPPTPVAKTVEEDEVEE